MIEAKLEVAYVWLHVHVCYGPIANRWPAFKRADPIVSRPAGLQAGQLVIAGQEVGRCGLKAGRARRTTQCMHVATAG